jgi:hypothetical protein
MSDGTNAVCTKTPIIGTVEPAVALDGTNIVLDENNIVTLTVRYLRKETELSTTPEKFTAFGGFGPFHLDSFTCEAMNDSSSSYIVTATYKSLYTVKKAGEGGNASEYGVVESMDYDFSEEPLEAHPNIVNIARKYGGVPRFDGTWDFPAKKPAAVTGRAGFAFESAGLEVNPLYGQKTYPALQARYTRTFGCDMARIHHWVNQTGQIYGGIPDTRLDLSTAVRGRDWLQLPPKIEKQGIFYRCSVEFLLSAPGKKWPEDVFEKEGAA